MKKINLLAILFAIIAMVACNPIEQQPGGETPKGEGTQAKPYSVPFGRLSIDFHDL